MSKTISAHFQDFDSADFTARMLRNTVSGIEDIRIESKATDYYMDYNDTYTGFTRSGVYRGLYPEQPAFGVNADFFQASEYRNSPIEVSTDAKIAVTAEEDSIALIEKKLIGLGGLDLEIEDV